MTLQPLDYERTEPADHRPIVSRELIVAFGAICTALFFVFAQVVPPFEVLYRDFRTQLPSLTKLALYISHWTIHEYGWLAFVSFPIAAPILITLATSRPRTATEQKRGRRVLMRVVLCMGFLIVVLTLWAIFAPMFWTMEIIH